MLIFLLKELFRNYIANGSSMYVTMLDASKAFDKVNHSKLFGKLIDRGCPAFIVRTLYHWYGSIMVPNNLPSDGVRDFLAFLLFLMVLNRAESFPPIFSMCTWMTFKC